MAAIGMQASEIPGSSVGILEICSCTTVRLPNRAQQALADKGGGLCTPLRTTHSVKVNFTSVFIC